MAIDYTIPQFQTTQDASVPKGTIQVPTIPAPVYSTPDPGSIYDQSVQPESQLSKDTTAQLEQYRQLLGIQGLAGQEQAQQFSTLGGAEAQTRLADLTAQYKVADLQNMAQQQAYLGQTRGIGGYTQTAQTLGMEDINRANAVRKLGLASDIAINQGRVDTAKSLAEQAIKAKYGDVQARIDQTKAFLDINKELLSREDAKNLQRQQFILQNKQKEIDAKVKDQTDISNMIIEATPNAPANVIANAKKIAEQGGSRLAVAQALGKYGGDYLGDLVKRSTIAKNQAEYNKTIEEIKKLNQPIQNTAPVGTQAHSTNSWVNSATNKESLSAGEREKISKSFAVVGQLGNLATALQKDQTSFFGGKVREIKAALGADANAGAIQAQITALVPQVARGTFGEVGVLTDADISNYKKVIGNLSSPNAQNAAVTAMTLTALRNGIKSQLDTAAASKLDVSRFVPMYQDLTNQINQINDEIGVTDQQVRQYMLKNPQTQSMIEQLIIEGRKGSEILQVLGVEN